MTCIINEKKRKRGNRTKLLSGKEYDYILTCTTKKEAEERKRVGKRQALLVRIVKTERGYDIYVA